LPTAGSLFTAYRRAGVLASRERGCVCATGPGLGPATGAGTKVPQIRDLRPCALILERVWHKTRREDPARTRGCGQEPHTTQSGSARSRIGIPPAKCCQATTPIRSVESEPPPAPAAAAGPGRDEVGTEQLISRPQYVNPPNYSNSYSALGRGCQPMDVLLPTSPGRVPRQGHLALVPGSPALRDGILESRSPPLRRLPSAGARRAP